MIPHDHADALDLIWTQFLNSPRVVGVIEKMLVGPANQAELLLELATKHNIVDAAGLELDDLGALLDLTRESLGGLADAEYRFALVIRARSVFAGGSIEGFTVLLRALLPDYPSAIPVIEWFPAAVRVYLNPLTPEEGKLLEALLAGVLPAAGINTVIAVHDGRCVNFSSSHGEIKAEGWFGSSHGPTDTEAGWAHAIAL